MADTVPALVYRILDAAIDRVREALRVLEDSLRFIEDNRELTTRLKEFRHAFAQTVEPIPLASLLACRSTETDVGTAIETGDEYRRESRGRILAANFCRLQESLRSIEEYSKMGFPGIARKIERLRYDSYILQKDVFIGAPGLFELNDTSETTTTSMPFPASGSSVQAGISPPLPRTEKSGESESSAILESRLARLRASYLYVLVETGISDSDFQGIARGGAQMFQLRDKHASDRELLHAARRMGHLLDELAERGEVEFRPLLIVNDRPDLAILAGADGVHVGQSEIPVADVRKLVGSDMLIGLSTSTVQEFRDALGAMSGSARVDCLGLGPVFPTVTKQFDEAPPGLELLRQAAAEPGISIAGYPPLVYAIGGITRDNVAGVATAGFPRVAVANAVTGQPDMAAATRILSAGIAKARQ